MQDLVAIACSFLKPVLSQPNLIKHKKTKNVLFTDKYILQHLGIDL